MTEQNQNFVLLIAAPELYTEEHSSALESKNEYTVIKCKSPDEIADKLISKSADLVIVEQGQPELDPLDIIIKVRSSDPDTPIIFIADKENTANDQLWSYGIDDLIKQPFTPVEFQHRIARSLKMRRLVRLHNILKRENTGLRKLSQTDGLTQLTNRRAFTDIMNTEFARVSRFGGELGCLMVDIDFFKKVNDTFGHLTGDRILKTVADLIRESVRSIDIVARYGGEEFILLLPETARPGIKVVAEKIRTVIEGTDFRDHNSPHGVGPESITVSIGGSSYPIENVKSVEELVKRADQALYQAKDAGRNKTIIS